MDDAILQNIKETTIYERKGKCQLCREIVSSHTCIFVLLLLLFHLTCLKCKKISNIEIRKCKYKLQNAFYLVSFEYEDCFLVE